MTSSEWKQLAGFVKHDGTPVSRVPPGVTQQYVRPVGTTANVFTDVPSGDPDDISFTNDISDDASLPDTSPQDTQVSEGASA
eukprot:scaffold101024_cov43-Cyclotella_meneghiniana.AAC.1